jgi:hypothetical protein
MDEDTLKKLSEDIEDLKRAVRRNDPLLHEVAAPPGWMAFSLAAGLNVTLFALPAHVLVTRHGSFAAIPLGYRVYLWAVLGLFVVIGGTLKVVLMKRRANEVSAGLGFSAIFEAFYGGKSAHETIPMMLGMIVGTAYAFWAGHPWLALPLSSFLFGIIANSMASRSGLKAYYVVGYASVLLGLAALPFVERAPFLWLFIIYGGMLFGFSAAQAGFSRERKQRRDAGSGPAPRP